MLDISHHLHSICNTTNKLINNTYHNLRLAQRNQNSKINKHRTLRKFAVGDTAYLKSPNKYNKGYSGPFQVKKFLSPVVVLIQEIENPCAPLMKRHINLLHWAPQRKNIVNNNSLDSNSSSDVVDVVDPVLQMPKAEVVNDAGEQSLVEQLCSGNVPREKSASSLLEKPPVPFLYNHLRSSPMPPNERKDDTRALTPSDPVQHPVDLQVTGRPNHRYNLRRRMH